LEGFFYRFGISEVDEEHGRFDWVTILFLRQVYLAFPFLALAFPTLYYVAVWFSNATILSYFHLLQVRTTGDDEKRHSVTVTSLLIQQFVSLFFVFSKQSKTPEKGTLDIDDTPPSSSVTLAWSYFKRLSRGQFPFSSPFNSRLIHVLSIRLSFVVSIRMECCQK
jgi:hypothetical protein